MNNPQEASGNSIQQQIFQLQLDYTTALESGKQFECLKQIRTRIKTLEAIFLQKHPDYFNTTTQPPNRLPSPGSIT